MWKLLLLLIIRQLCYLPVNTTVFPSTPWISVYAIFCILNNLNIFLTLSTACRVHEAQDSKASYSYHQDDLFERFTVGLPETQIFWSMMCWNNRRLLLTLATNRLKMFSILWASGSQGSELKIWKCGHGLVPGVGLCSFFLPGGPCCFI